MSDQIETRGEGGDYSNTEECPLCGQRIVNINRARHYPRCDGGSQ